MFMVVMLKKVEGTDFYERDIEGAVLVGEPEEVGYEIISTLKENRSARIEVYEAVGAGRIELLFKIGEA